MAQQLHALAQKFKCKNPHTELISLSPGPTTCPGMGIPPTAHHSKNARIISRWAPFKGYRYYKRTQNRKWP
eukprot:scaffold20725_cov111-Isochrysis_galbana.AAC.19